MQKKVVRTVVVQESAGNKQVTEEIVGVSVEVPKPPSRRGQSYPMIPPFRAQLALSLEETAEMKAYREKHADNSDPVFSMLFEEL